MFLKRINIDYNFFGISVFNLHSVSNKRGCTIKARSGSLLKLNILYVLPIFSGVVARSWLTDSAYFKFVSQEENKYKNLGGIFDER